MMQRVVTEVESIVSMFEESFRMAVAAGFASLKGSVDDKV